MFEGKPDNYYAAAKEDEAPTRATNGGGIYQCYCKGNTKLSGVLKEDKANKLC
jgi:hypothetical protein